MYKLRTMKSFTHNKREDLQNLNTKSGPLFKIDDDPRFIKGAKTLRRFSLDEIPQFLNVLKGNLNLVGFRPGLVNQKELNDARKKNGIFNHMPGITGLAQVTGYDMSNPEMLGKIEKYYYANKSLKLDFQILLCTLTGVFRIKLRQLVNNSIDV